jgi:class 3 adenylate cyclase
VAGPAIYAVPLMFCGLWGRMLASMSEIDPHADTPLVDWSELGVSGLLPTGTVTLLLADVEGSTRLWETPARRDDDGHRPAK